VPMIEEQPEEEAGQECAEEFHCSGILALSTCPP
jgi:hypothetical protein